MLGAYGLSSGRLGARWALSLALALSALLLAPWLRADDFSDFKELFEKLASSMDEAMQLPQDSMIAVDYEHDLSALEVKARALQAGLTKLKADNVNLPRIVSMLPEVYSMARARAAKARAADDYTRRSIVKDNTFNFTYKKIYDPKGRPIDYDCREDLISLIREQIEQLDSMNFKMDGDSMSIDPCAFSPSAEYARLLDNYTRNIIVVSSLHRGTLWRDHFEKGLRNMGVLANEMHQAMVAKDFKLAMSLNIQANTAALREIYNAIPKSELANDKSPAKSVKLKGDSSTKRSLETVEKEACYVADKLAKGIAAFRSLGLDAELGDSESQGSEAPAPAAQPEGQPKGQPLPGQHAVLPSKDSLDPLWKPILAERERIWALDTEMVGASKETVAAYSRTLTKKEKELFEKALKIYSARLIDKTLAESNALREIHLRSASPEEFTSRDELVQLSKSLGLPVAP